MATNPMIKVTRAVREKCKASIVIEGLSGRGKTGLALEIANALAEGDWEKVGDIDTEKKSMNLYNGVILTSGATVPAIKKVDLTADIGYAPTNYLACQNALKEAGCEVIIKDSISHAWSYSGGVLDKVAQAKANNTRYQKDSYAAWSDAEVMKEKNELLSLLRDDEVHCICTVRVKEKMEYDKDAEGKTILKSLGEQQIMQADMKYEPDLVISMIQPGVTDPESGAVISYPKGKITKSRYVILKVDEEYEFTPALLKQLATYLADGVDTKEILAQQKQEYVEAITAYLDAHKGAIPIWNVIKEDAGYKDKKLADIPLKDLKPLYNKLTIN